MQIQRIPEVEQVQHVPEFQQVQHVQEFQQVQHVPEFQQVQHVQEVQPVQQFFQPDPTLQPEPITPSPEIFVPSVEPVPVTAATPPPQFNEQIEGFAGDYEEHIGWINDAIDPPSPDMVPELSWTDLGPNGPLMTNDGHIVIPPQAVDRRRKAKPIHHPQQTVVPVKKQQPSARQAPVPVPVEPVYVPKPTPIKKQIPPPTPKYFVASVPTAQPKFAPYKSAPKFTASPVIASTFAPIFTPSTPLPSQKPIKQKPVKQLTQHKVTKTTTTIRPPANTDYFYDDDTYDDSPIKQPKQP